MFPPRTLVVAKGAPTKRWTLTERANRHFVDRHRELVMDLFDELRESLGPDDFGAVLIKRGERQVEWYRDRIDRSLSLEEQVQALAEIRDQEGYMAEAQKGPDGSCLLIEKSLSDLLCGQELLEAVLCRARRISSKY